MKTKGNYVDGFVFPVAKENLKAYKKMAQEGAAIWKKCGALDYYECQGDDLVAKDMGDGSKPRSFNELGKPGDTVWFSFIVFKNKAHRKEVNKKVMAYFSKKYADQKDYKMPFDPNKMFYGGFKTIVNL